ncbi:putative Fatty acid desaturase [Trypanosoma vivax]|uniref:Putative fatty acid desaturase n=1 Tax=Trypanosoma vivax (strain Y486) TaxID=1055687 RepID=G0U1I8_TRYVY|nr:putative fatty acid desaturase [Trypanosoma vivax]KAH8617020.1 putative Fatty acid desaturase [Trypanosoma vivax]CCC49945.1 putative fatty acid desaturase [Trypanosoma vivax Y486]
MEEPQSPITESRYRDMIAAEKAQYDIPQWSKGNYEINWIAVAVLFLPPTMSLVAFMMGVPLQTRTLMVGFLFYIFNGLIGITLGYHRLFSHRSFRAHPVLQWICVFAGAGAFEGSAKWWCRNHRVHHRYVDTFKDPYDATRGFFFSHIGWMLMKPNRDIPCKVGVADFKYNNIIQFQHRHFFKIAILSGIILPTLVCGLGWGDWLGGYFYAALLKIVFVHHCTFFINSLAHTSLLGAKRNYSDRHTSHDSVVCALLTFGEGYHNFHHEFCQDYRNGVKWYHYDPTKWTIRFCEAIGLATSLVRTPEDVITRSVMRMQHKRMLKESASAASANSSESPAMGEYTWGDIERLVKEGRRLVVVDDNVIDLMRSVPTEPNYTAKDEDSYWYNLHIEGKQLLEKYMGRDATAVFRGGVHNYSIGVESILPHLCVAKLKTQ